MEAVMGETGEGSKEGTDCSINKTDEVRVNGEMNGSCEEDMEVCDQVSQHDSTIVNKSLGSDVISDKSIKEDNSLSDNASNCSKDFNSTENSSDNEREDKVKVPNRIKLRELGVCKDLVPEVEENDEECEIVRSEEMDTDETDDRNDTQGVDASDKLGEDESVDTARADASSERNHVTSNDKHLGSNESNTDTKNRNKEVCSNSDNEKDSESINSEALEPENKFKDKKNEKSENVNHVDKSNNASSTDTPTEEGKETSKEKPNESKENKKEADIKEDDSKSEKLINISSEDSIVKDDDDEDEKKEEDMDPSDTKSEDTPGKIKKARKSTTIVNITPRRSSRNLSKTQKSYIEKEEDPDIEEITPQDPLADPLSTDSFRDDKENSKTRNTRKTTIVVNDTKRLVEIATGTKSVKGGKKEPTLVIIDTNSILSGRGPVPVSQGPQPATSQSHHTQISAVPIQASSSSSSYSVLPVAVPAQGMYPSNSSMRINTPVQTALQTPKPPQILPTLTDDMYVVEAPSFIVPYVYEKPPIKPLKEFVEKLGKELAELKEKEEKEKQERKEKEEREKQEREEKEKHEKEEREKQEKEDKEKKEKEEKEKQEKEEKIKLDKEEEMEITEEEEKENAEKDLERKSDSMESRTVESDSDKDSFTIKKGKDDDQAEEKTKDKNLDKTKDPINMDNKNDNSNDKTKGTTENSDKENQTKQDGDKKDQAEKKEEGDAKKGSDTSKGSQETSENKDKPPVPSKSENKPPTYFDNPLGKFFMQIGVNLVQEYVQTDLLRSQRRKRDVGKGGAVTQFAINSLLKNLELSKENNEPFHMEQKKCEYCSFKTESSLVMAQHLETPHMRNYVYRCNFCPLEVRSPHDILFHMEAEHNVRGRLERAPAFHQCPNCPFEDNQKGKLTRHLLSCVKKHKPDRNQEPPPDWEPPAKIPRVSRSRPASLGLGAAAYQAIAGKQASQHHPLLPKLVPAPSLAAQGLGRGRGRPPIHARYHMSDMKVPSQRGVAPPPIRQGMIYRPQAPTPSTPPQMILPTTYQIAGNQIYQVVGSQGQMMPVVPSGISSVPRLTVMPQSSASTGGSAPTPVALVPNIAAGNNSITIQSANNKNPAAKLLQQPSISITPLPRQPTGIAPGNPALAKHGTHPGGKATFVICEICDGYIKDLEQLRNHMQWIHKVKIHPKMIYNRPPLNCQKCQFRFFTDQGLERHLLGSHGLVTSSMQEAANKGRDGGRCPVCGRVYQWKLLNHVSRDHNMTLKPAHLSYKCTVCTATFGMYKQFENHVYSAHSVVAKRVMDKKAPQVPRPQQQQNDAILKPLKINDEITIIPQPARPRPGPASRTGAISALIQEKNPPSKVHECENCEATFDGPSGFTMYLGHIRRRHLRRCGVKLCRLDGCPTCKERYITQDMIDFLEDQKEGVDVIELSDDEVVIAGQGRNEITITKVSCAPGPRRFKQRLQQSHNVQVIELEDSPVKNANNSSDGAGKENGEDSLTAVKERLRRRKSLEISQVDSECSSPQSSDDMPAKKKRRADDD